MIDQNKFALKLALGTAQFGLPYGIANQSGQITRREAKAMLQLALTRGINTLDTAMAYGESEVCLGEVGGEYFNLVTKLPELPADCKDVSAWVRKQFDQSLARLGVNSIYGLLLYRPEQLIGTNDQMLYQILQELKESGQVQKIGVSIYAPRELDFLVPHFRFDLVQAPFNLIDRCLLTSGWLQRLKKEDIEIHTRSAFLQGLLLMSYSDIPAKFASWHSLWDKWHHWLQNSSTSAVQACLAYPLSFSEVDKVVIGADSSNQLEQILNSLETTLPKDFPDLASDDVNLINPAFWSRL